ncbi:MFS transporter [Martelella mediterranea]|uniref:MFS transporter n=1 Tax=Martelella mediterranea TaxID=293089 RepID=UPI001E3F1709|nr:MFS transporter [Martelella mediterranea]MCD1632896.1 MFS transporter [Martelella mediterranea]
MKRNLLPVFALLLGTLFLFLGNGLHGLLLPLRGAAEGYSDTALGLIGTSWASGFVLGCLFAPKLIMRIGHVRAFSGFIAIICMVALMTGIYIDEYAWIALRAATGFAMAGTQMIIESWLNERVDNSSRGVVFTFYTGITLFGVVGGQLVVGFGNTNTAILFMVAGIFYCVAMLPTTMSNAASPRPLQAVRIDIKLLYRNSPVACIGVLLTGIANGAFGTLIAVFATRAGLPDAEIALLVTSAILAGALAQVPFGKISDMTDRRYVIAALAGTAALAALMVFLLKPGAEVLIGLVVIYGATANVLYPVTASHANDFARPEDYVKISSGLLFLFGIGTIIGPTVGGPVMSAFGPYALFIITALAHLMILAYALLRARLRPPVPMAEREAFMAMPDAATPVSTREGVAFRTPPREYEEESAERAPANEEAENVERG